MLMVQDLDDEVDDVDNGDEEEEGRRKNEEGRKTLYPQPEGLGISHTIT